MKVSIDIDCTPEEARAFFGLPDLREMQKVMMTRMQERMEESMEEIKPEEMAKAWFSPGMEGFNLMQKAFSDAMKQQTKTD